MEALAQTWKSRGELVLEAFVFQATEAANAMKDLNSSKYKSFNLIVGDNKNLYWIANSNTRKYKCGAHSQWPAYGLATI